jgi:hypothetical protein
LTERPKGVRVTNASVLIAADVDVKEVTHIAGEDNQQCDRLSRRWDVGKTRVI